MRSEGLNPDKFARLRYAQCWEDADVLVEALDVGPRDTCLSIASAGDNTLALVGEGANRVIAVDLNPAQIACLELRVAAYRCLSYDELLELLGHRPSTRRRSLYVKCRGHLSREATAYWDRNWSAIAAGITGRGKFERYLTAFRKLVLPLIHSPATVNRLFEMSSEQERREFFERKWNSRRWEWMCEWFFCGRLLGRFGRDPDFTRFADEPVWNSLKRRIPNALIVQQPADNPYLQWILTGRFQTSLPYALRADNFSRIRDNLDALEWHCESLDVCLQSMPAQSIDGFNLSNVFEYMSEEAYVRLLEELARVGTSGCRLVYWNVVVDRQSPASMRHMLLPREGLARRLHTKDKAPFYRRLVVEEVCQ